MFVDDEKRVLNSMRGLFRREFELFLTTEGNDAVRIAAENPIDVVVADQRMPGMSGIEVLGKVKELSPRTVRILLTGYADPDAVEGSINIGEVFRFLSKPCPPQILRETLNLAVAASRSAAPVRLERVPAAAKKESTRPVASAVPRRKLEDTLPPTLTPFSSQRAEVPRRPPPRSTRPSRSAVTSTTPIRQEGTPPSADSSSSHWENVTSVVLSGDTSQEVRAPDFSSGIRSEIKDVGIVFFTVDPGFAETAMRAAAGDRNVTLATTLSKVAQTIERKEAGVLVTDFTTNRSMLHKMIGVLKQQLPELVTIVASNGRDTTDMISLINHGQVFRYVLKPIEPKNLMYEINAAAIKHLDLLNNPDAAKRHEVMTMEESDEAPQTLNNFVTRIQKLRSRQFDPEDSSA